ncbi:MAG: proline dehydrogenase family protein [Blastocatellia bacterium]
MNLIKKTVWGGWTRLARLASRSYLAGAELEDALRVCRRFNERSFAISVCYWNGTNDEPRQVADHYLATLDALSCEDLNGYLSIKAPALGFNRALVAEITERAERSNIRVHFDALAPDTVEPTFDLIAASLQPTRHIGCTLPGRWHRSLADADRAVALGLDVRVVKGEWADPTHPDIDLRAGFLEVIDRLAGRARHVGVATHDAELAREAVRRLQAAGTSCELEQLFGLPLKASIQVAHEMNAPVRLYVPYGNAWVPYCLSQIRKRPRILWWIAQDAIFGRSLSLLDASRSAPEKV